MKIFFPLIVCCMLASCSKWIDVKPADRLSGEMLFQDREGYLKALNGVYVEMANTSLYGQDMTAGVLDVLAHYYYLPSSLHRFYYYTNFEYTQAEVKTTFDNTWKKAYQLIANCNVLIEECDKAPAGLLPEPYFSIVKGEALALRAMLHLDMLRLFGPLWTDENKSLPSIPYVSKSGFEVSPILPNSEAVEHVLNDLEAALALLENTDPVRTEGVRNAANPAGPNDLYYRQYRLNYYAVKALIARTHLWKNDKQAAFSTASELLQEVQDPARNTFPYVSQASATHAETPDRMFSPEVMFAVYNINRVNMFNALFSAALVPDARLSFNSADVGKTRVNELYDDANDYRLRIWQEVTSGTTTLLTNLKYQDITNAPGRYMIPLIRLSEVLLIAAECSPDLNTGTGYLNEVRTSRSAFSLYPTDETALKAAITREFRKETIGEGQAFFYFKRNAMQVVPNSGALTGTQTMELNDYVIPLPDSETSQRND